MRLGEVIERDMTAVPVTGDLRLVVVGAPAYFARHPRPEHPRDLAAHARTWRGELVPVLEAFSTPFPGFSLNYPARRP